MMTEPVAKLSFKQRMWVVREEAIVHAVNRLLAEKGFEAMTVDEVAEQVGIAKASLYKHFSSKEDLAAAAVLHLVRRGQDFINGLSTDAGPLANLSSVMRWVVQVKLAGGMPTLPSQCSSLRTALLDNRACMDGLSEVSDRLGGWIEAAQAGGQLNAKLPALAILHVFYARAFDPAVEFLKMDKRFSDEQIIEMVLTTCFYGLIDLQAR